jgi:hypothetical protein
VKPKAEPTRLFPDSILMTKGMKDQELDRLMRQIAEDASLDDVSVEEIADSPSLWWSVQREIRGTSPAKSPWPPNLLRRWLMVGLPVAAAIVLGLGLYLGSSKIAAPDVANGPHEPFPEAVTLSEPRSVAPLNSVEPTPIPILDTPGGPAKSEVRPTRVFLRTKPPGLPRAQVAKTRGPKATEIRSDFIALAYARDPESGQIIRVKVPSSMMVQLGVVSTVERPSELVDAEVLVGDDGLTRAIRFIRQ